VSPAGEPVASDPAEPRAPVDPAKDATAGKASQGATQNAAGESPSTSKHDARASADESVVTVEGGPPLRRKSPVASLGSLSIGHAHEGYLLNGVRMPPGKEWVVGVPQHAWGTEETVANLIHCIRKVAERFPDTPRVMLGSLSPEHGGHAPPHKSHRTGRDVDVYLYRLPGFRDRWNKPATAEDLDRARTWALIRFLATETDVEFILLDRRIQAMLEEHARRAGEDPAWLDDLFRGSGKPYSALVKHVPGHVAHLHVRFYSWAARERARLAYDRLVQQGHVQLPRREVVHEVERGDTLIGIAKRYATSVELIRETNQLGSELIKVGQRLTIAQRVDVRGARERVHVPPRRLPPSEPERGRNPLARRDAPSTRAR
jgi:murein endopeptidase